MSPKTLRLTGEASSNPKMVELSQDPTVISAKAIPTASAACEGVGRERRRGFSMTAMRPGTLVPNVPKVRFPQAVRPDPQDLVGEAGHGVGDAQEHAPAEHEHLHVGVGRDGCRAGPTVEQGELAEVLARTQLGDLWGAAPDRGRALQDEEELVPGTSFLDEDAPRLDVDLVGRT